MTVSSVLCFRHEIHHNDYPLFKQDWNISNFHYKTSSMFPLVSDHVRRDVTSTKKLDVVPQDVLSIVKEPGSKGQTFYSRVQGLNDEVPTLLYYISSNDIFVFFLLKHYSTIIDFRDKLNKPSDNESTKFVVHSPSGKVITYYVNFDRYFCKLGC